MSDPKSTKQWRVIGRGSFENLQFEEAEVPELGLSEVLVKSKQAHLRGIIEIELTISKSRVPP